MSGREQAPGEGDVPGDVGVGAGAVLGGGDLVGGLEDLSRLAEVVTGPEGKCVRLDDDGGPAITAGDPALGFDDRAVVEPREQAEGEEVLAPLGVAWLCSGRLAGLDGERGHRYLVDTKADKLPSSSGLVSYPALARSRSSKESELITRIPPVGRSATFAFKAAGFIATRTFGASPGVKISWSEMWIWNADTPARVPAGARISAG